MNHSTLNNSLEVQLNATRIKLYEQTKHMTTEERVAFFNKGAKDILARHGIKAKYVEKAPVSPQAQPQ